MKNKKPAKFLAASLALAMVTSSVLPTLPTYSVSAGGINKSNFQSVEKASKLSQKITPEVSINNVEPTQKASESIANVAVAPVQKVAPVAPVQKVAVMATPILTDGDYTYIENKDGTLTITGYKGTSTEISIPEKINNKTVTAIGKSAFYNTKITNVVIPNSVTTIGDGAFYECRKLHTVKLFEGITAIGENTFLNCIALKNITIPNSVTTIGDSAFGSCAFTGITIPENVTSIGDSAFRSCTKLIGITIPENVTSIKASTFQYCYELESITIPNKVTTIGNLAFEGCGKLETLKIGTGVTGIGYSAFERCGLTKKVTIPGNVKTIGENAFKACGKLETLEICKGVKEIGANAFYDCMALYSITMEEDLEKIGHAAFAYSAITTLTIPNSVTEIGSCAFLRCQKLGTVTFGTKPETELETKLVTIGNSAFSECDSLKKIKIPNKVTSIGDSTFYRCDLLDDVTIPDSVTSIGDSTFRECDKLKKIAIPNGVTSIGNLAFYYCYNLTDIELGNSVKNIHEMAFDRCSVLLNITVNEENPNFSVSENVLFNKDKTTLVKYPLGKKGTEYAIPNTVNTIGKSAFYDCDKLTKIVVPNSVTTISDNAFNDCYNLTDIKLGTDIKTIGNSAFYRCRSLTGITIPEDVTTIGDNAFCDCEALKSITIPNKVTTIGKEAFSQCKILKTVDLGKEVKTIGDRAFSSCTELTSIKLPNKLEKINSQLFSSCTKLTNVTIGKSVKTIATNAFDYSSIENITVDAESPNFVSIEGVLFNKDKTTLVRYPLGKKETKYTIPDNVTTIGDWAFSGCYKLAEADLGKDVTTIGDYAFYNCQALTSVTIPKKVTTIDSMAFYYCRSLTNALFLGDVPTKFATYVFESAASNFEINYILGKKGWTSPSWKGYKAIPYGATIDYVLNGGTNNENNKYFYSVKETLPLLPATKAGETFCGWYENPDFTGTAITEIPVGSTGVKTLYAKFTNDAPTLNGTTDLVITVGDSFNPMANVTASDKEDGDLTKAIVVTSNLDTTKAGNYNVTYTVTDSKGLTATATIVVTVKELPNTAPTLNGTKDLVITVGDSFNPMANVTASDKEDGDLTKSIVVTSNLDTTKAGTYNVTYTVTDSKGLTATATIVVTVKELPNTAPTLNGTKDLVITVGDSFNPMANVTASDKEDGDLTKAIVVTSNLDTTKAGTYNVTYTVTDSKGLTATATIVVTVKELPNTAPTLNGTKDLVITVGDSFNPMANVTASDKEDGDLTKSIVVTSNLDTTKAGNYNVTYTVTDSKGLTATATIVVTVKAIAEVFPEWNRADEATGKYVAGTKVSYKGVIYIQSTKTTSWWAEPSATSTVWKAVGIDENYVEPAIKEWNRNDEAAGKYVAGTKVTYKGVTYIQSTTGTSWWAEPSADSKVWKIVK